MARDRSIKTGRCSRLMRLKTLEKNRRDIDDLACCKKCGVFYNKDILFDHPHEIDIDC